MKNNNKKYELIIAAKNKIVEYDFSLHASNIEDLISSCKGKTLRKYVKHVLRCGSFYNDQFYMPSTRLCLDTKVKNKPMTFEYDE